jgi:hypothetical protein
MKEKRNSFPVQPLTQVEQEIGTKKNQCSNCLHWFKYPKESLVSVGMINLNTQQAGEWGDCRRYPPVIAGSHPGFQLQLQGRLGHFPATISSNSCGEFIQVSS